MASKKPFSIRASDVPHHADCERRAFARRVKPDTSQNAAAIVGIAAHAGVEAVVKAGLHLEDGSTSEKVSETLLSAAEKSVPKRGKITWDRDTPTRRQAVTQSVSLSVRILARLEPAGLASEHLQAERAWEIEADDGIVVRARADLVLAGVPGEVCADIKTGASHSGAQLQLGACAVLAAASDEPIAFETLGVIHAPRSTGIGSAYIRWAAEPLMEYSDAIIGKAIESAKRILDAGDGKMEMEAVIASTTANPTSKMCNSWGCPIYQNGCPLTDNLED